MAVSLGDIVCACLPEAGEVHAMLKTLNKASAAPVSRSRTGYQVRTPMGSAPGRKVECEWGSRMAGWAGSWSSCHHAEASSGNLCEASSKLDVGRVLSKEERQRYDRQLRIARFGVEGQGRLKEARVLVAGIGGLGSAISTYLAAAGVGSLRIVDRDVVELSNLNRQILHWTQDIGREKAQSAEEKLRRINPHTQIEPITMTITRDNVLELTAACDLIIDAMDNYECRYLLNRAALDRGIPFIHGGVYGMEGVLTTMVPGQTACLRCIFPEPPPSATLPVLGVIPGIIGCLQALEAIKHITGVGELMTNRFLIVDGAGLSFTEVKLERNPRCPDCSRRDSGVSEAPQRR